MTIYVPQNGVYWFRPEDFGFPTGASFSDYKNYYVRITSYPIRTWPVYYVVKSKCLDTSSDSLTSTCLPYSDWNIREFYYDDFSIWFPNLSNLGIYTPTILPIDVPSLSTYSISYEVYQKSAIPIAIKSSNRNTPINYPSFAEVTGVTRTDVSDISLYIPSISHTFLSDTNLVLVGPSGAGIAIFYFPNARNTSGAITFSDSGINFTDATAFSTGNCKPLNKTDLIDRNGPSFEFDIKFGTLVAMDKICYSFSELLSFEKANGGINGVWKIYWGDEANGDGGEITNWTLNLIENSVTKTFSADTTLTSGFANLIRSNTVSWQVALANTAPSHTLPAIENRTAFPGLDYFFSLSVIDDAYSTCILSTNITTSIGTITVPSSSGATVTNNNTNNVTIQGTLNQINLTVCCNNVKITVPENAPSQFTVTVTTNDNRCSATVDIVNGDPLITVDSFVITVQRPLPPVGCDFGVWINSGNQITINYNNFKIIDTKADGYYSSLKSIVVYELPKKGSILLSGMQVQVGQEITCQQLQQNNLVYAAPILGSDSKNVYEMHEFKFFVVNDVNTNLLINGGQNRSALPAVCSLFVIKDYVVPAINHQETLVVNEGVEINIDAQYFGYKTLDDLEADYNQIKFTTLPSIGTLYSFGEVVILDVYYPVKGLTYIPPASVSDYTSFNAQAALIVNPKNYTFNLEQINLVPVIYTYAYGMPGTISINPSILTIDTTFQYKNIVLTIGNMNFYYWNRFKIKAVSPDNVDTILYNQDWSPDSLSYTIAFSDSYTQNIATAQGSGLNLKIKPSQNLEAINGISSGDWKLDITDFGYSSTPSAPSVPLTIDYWSVRGTAERPGPRAINIAIYGIINPVDDPPRIVSNNVIVTSLNTNQYISGISLYDPDALAASVSIQIVSLHGVLNILNTNTATITGNISKNITISGTYLNVKQIIETVNNIVYTPDSYFIGQDTISFTVTTTNSIRTTKINAYVKPGGLILGNKIGKENARHSEQLDTVVKIYYQDPRIDGRYYVGDKIVAGPPKPVPDFEGQLVAFLTYTTEWKAHLLCGHNHGTGLQWSKVVSSSASSSQTLIDSRTGLPYDPYWQSNCDPPWLCG